MNLLLDLAKWIGLPPIQTVVDSLKNVQKADFDKLHAGVSMSESKIDEGGG